jgi:hypothetical protein
MVVERIDRSIVGRNGEVVEEAVHHSFQVKCLLRAGIAVFVASIAT